MHVQWHFHGVNYAVYYMPVHQSPALESPRDTENCLAERARDGFCTCCSCRFWCWSHPIIDVVCWKLWSLAFKVRTCFFEHIVLFILQLICDRIAELLLFQYHFPYGIACVNAAGMLVWDLGNYGKESMRVANGLKLKLRQCPTNQIFLLWMHQALFFLAWSTSRRNSVKMAKQALMQMRVWAQNVGVVLHVKNSFLFIIAV